MLSIRRKFNIGILAVAIFSSILTGLVSIFQGRKIVETEAKKVLLLTASNYANLFETELNKLQLHERSLEGFICSVNDDTLCHNSLNTNKKNIAKFIRHYCKSNSIFSLWVVFNPDYFGYPLVLSMYDSLGTKNYVFEPNYDIRELDPNGNETKWWRDAIKYGEVWTSPYYWEPWNKYIISYSKAMYIGSKAVAVLGSDFNFNALKDSVTKFKIYESGYIWMMDSSFNIFSHPQYEGKNLRDFDVNNFIINTLNDSKLSQGNIEYSDSGSAKKIMAFKRLSNGWYICVSAPYNEIFKGSVQILRFIGLIILITIIVGFIISYKISKAITSPINRFVESFVKGATGDFTIRVPETSKDELRLLESHFNHFLEKTQRLVQELNETHESLINAKDAADRSNKLKTSFLANMSHEIRTPLNAVIGFTSLLKINSIPEADRSKYIELAITNSYNLLGIVESIIEFSSLEVGKPDFKYTTFKLNLFLQNFNDYLNANLKYSLPDNLNFVISTSADDIILFSDPDKIRRILFHLTDNAFKFTNSGMVELGYAIKDNHVVFFVKDTGVGIKKENEKLIWESFYKIDAIEQRSYVGAGLGLSICRKLVEIIHGQLWFESVEGNGTTFYLSIPIIKPSKANLDIPITQHFPEVLVIDEDIDSFREIHEKTVKLGIKDLWARNGAEALGLIAMEPTIKLVICNLYSNSIDGVLSIQLIKNVNARIKSLVIGNPKKINEMKEQYGIEFDFFSFDFIADGVLEEIMTLIKQKEQH